MAAICGNNCEHCHYLGQCGGCEKTGGKPWGGTCIAAEYIKAGGRAQYDAFKKQILGELNAIRPEGTPEITALYELCGFYVNLAYPLPSGETVKFLDDKKIYLGAQVELPTGRCLGFVADTGFLLICAYSQEGKDPELVAYKAR